MSTTPSGLFYQDLNLQGLEIIKSIDQNPWTSITDSPNSRKTQHFGYKYDYKSRKIISVDEEKSIPEFLIPLQTLLTEQCQSLNLVGESYTFNQSFNQCIINNYETGQGISKHIDLPAFGGVIGCFTFGSGAVMSFRRGGTEVFNIYVRPNSLYIMSGESRYIWTHEMPSRKSDMVGGTKIFRDRRVSVTFRHVP